MVAVVTVGMSMPASASSNTVDKVNDPMFQRAFDTPHILSEESGIMPLDIVGQPVTSLKEGAYNNVGWMCRMSGSGAQCWIKLDYGTTATRLDCSLTVERSKGLWMTDSYQELTATAKNSNNVYARWDDGVQYVALSATGNASINGTRAAGLFVSGWW